MELIDLKEYLKTKVPDCKKWYLGKIDSNESNCIGIYPGKGVSPVIPIGGRQNKTYEVLPVSILVHWGVRYTEAQLIAQQVFNVFFAQRDIIGGYEVQNIEFNTHIPAYVGTDDKGILEFVIDMKIYYRRELITYA